MKKAALVVSCHYDNNKIFDIADADFNTDNNLYVFYALKQELATKDIELCTQDINSVDKSNYVIFNDMPHKIPQKQPWQKYYLLAMESIAVHPINYDQSRYDFFDRIFTWKDDIIDGKKIIKINYSYLISSEIDFNLAGKQKLACIVANNKASAHQLELYSSRVDIINWFETNHSDDLDLYGAGWDQLPPANLLAKMINRMKIARLFSAKQYSCYKGVISSKLPVLKKYRFSICYENIRDIPGYITEKIFHCFFAGCVPIYWGANNITDHIPKGCFIDKREFETYENLYDYMKNMSDTEYLSYLRCIDAFLKSERGYKFSAECFAETITKELVNG